MHRFSAFMPILLVFAAVPACSLEPSPTADVALRRPARPPGQPAQAAVAAGDAEDLYRKLLHPGYAGRTLRLKGRYVLSATAGVAAIDRLLSEDGFVEDDLDARVLEATQLGYIDLGDRDLEGQNQMVYVDQVADHIEVDPSHGETVIDGTQLESDTVRLDHYSVPDLQFVENRSLVRAREGNHIEGITLRWRYLGGAFQQAISVEGTGSRIKDCTFDVPGIQAGILAYARGKDVEGGQVSAELVGNIGDERVTVSFVIASTLFTRGAQTDIALIGNHMAPRLMVQHPASEAGTVRVTSRNNRYLSSTDGPGVLVRGGLAPGRFTHSMGNRSELTSVDDRFDGGDAGVIIVGGQGFGDKEASGNVVKVDLLRSTFHGPTIAATAADGPGSDNLVELLVRRSVADPSVAVESSHGAGDGNRMQIIGSQAEWEASNTGLIPPAAEFFVDG
jgi:hypothetical protein